jgi:hypothetical protein
MKTNGSGGGLPPPMRRRLGDLHASLLRLHKLLLDDERSIYETAHDPTAPGKLLQLVISDPQFAWLRRISELIVQIDELLESDEGEFAAATELMNQIRTLLAPGDSADEFARKYRAALQRQPDAMLAHREVTEILARSD